MVGRKRTKNQHLPRWMLIQHGAYYLKKPGTSRWIHLGRDYCEAFAKYANLTSGPTVFVTMGELLDDYARRILPLKAEKTRKDQLRQLRYIRAAFADVTLESMTRDPAKGRQAVLQFRAARGRHGPVEANREIALLSHVFSTAIEWGVITVNPCTGIKKTGEFAEVSRDRYVEDHELQAFQAFAGEFLSCYFEFKRMTGRRKVEILRIRRDQLRDDGIYFELAKKRKRKKVLIVTWTPPLRALVERILRIPRPVSSLFLFSTRRGQPYTTSGLDSMFQRKMVKALAQGVLAERFQERDVRAKTASDTDKAHATELLGHEDPRTTEIYRRKPAKVRPIK